MTTDTNSERLVNTVPRKSGIRAWILLGAAVASFLLYAALVKLIYPAQDHAFIPERSSLAAAASNVIYGAPLGQVYEGILKRSFELSKSTKAFLAEAASKKIPRGPLLRNTQDGNGIGYMLVADLGFRLFGVHISSILLVMLLLMGFSAAAFLYRFRDGRSALVVAYFTALIVMLFGPQVWLDYLVIQVPVGGIRYFSLVGILPALHLLLEFADPRPIRRSIEDFAPIAVQTIVLLIAVLVRNSGATMIGAIAIGCLLCLWKLRRDPILAKRMLLKSAFAAVVGALFIGVLLASFSRGYISEGRFTETVWHRIFVSLGLSPAWPFGNLREVYDCRRSIPAGLVGGAADQDGHCVFLVHLAKKGIPLETAGGTYGRQYDAALRAEFFQILRAYPADVLHVFTYVKAKYVIWAVIESLKFDFTRVPLLMVALLCAALVNFFAFAVLFGYPASPTGSLSVWQAIGLFAGLTMLPYFAVWAHPQTIADFLCYAWMTTGLLLVTVIGKVRYGHQAPSTEPS